MVKTGRKETGAEEGLSRQVLYLGEHEEAVNARLRMLAEENFVERMWQRDPTLWKKDEKSADQIRGCLGWLDAPEKMALHVDDIYEFAAEVLSAGLNRAVLMGMGGSSMAPIVFARTFGHSVKGMPVAVLDTTDPATVLATEKGTPLKETLFIIASKSGTTVEPNAFGEYFFERLVGINEITAGGNFAVITDPGSSLETLAKKRCFRSVIHNFKDIGGRYSAISYFGLVPAALMGLNIDKLVLRALRMEKACLYGVPLRENPGVVLGAAMGELARQGIDKLTFLVPESIGAIGLWLEQLIAESTGKEGTGILPVADEPLGDPSVYGEDRLFVCFEVKGQEDPSFEKAVDRLKRAGKPVIVIRLNDLFDIAQEFYRFEIATATAGRILDINPFDQPNVQESKDVTNKLLEEVCRAGGLTEAEPQLRERGLSFYGDTAGGEDGVTILSKFLARARTSDYVALQAYLTETPDATKALQDIRVTVRDRLGLATTMGYGPRFLHSTGQFHKGGPNKGLFLQITSDDEEDVAIPGSNYSFGVLKRAQAVGDMEALKKHGRRTIRVHVGGNTAEGLRQLSGMISEALSRRPLEERGA